MSGKDPSSGGSLEVQESSTEAAGASQLEHAQRLERALIRVRWFAAALALYLVTQTNAGQPPRASPQVLWVAYAVVAGVAGGNVAIALATASFGTLRAMRRVGLAAFALDAVVILSFSWIYSYDPRGVAWVVIYIIPLEGALRYRLRGAMVSVLLGLANEVCREAYLAHRFSHAQISGGAFIDRYPFLVSNVALRVGVEGIIALVAGFMARSLAREAERANDQALRFREAARREAAARRELAAFNTAVLTGVAAQDLDASFRLMAGAIGRDLGFETFSILLREGDTLVVKGMWGMPFYERSIPVGQGVTGTVAKTGQGLVVPDVRRFDGYIQADPQMRSEMAAPLRAGDEVIGVLDVESRTPGAFDVASLGALTRLADQVALVTRANLLLEQQVDTVARLQELDQMKSDFVAITSHELRTPITAIRGFVETILRNRDRLSEDQITSFMRIIDRQSGRLARLVEDLLLVSRIEAGAVRLCMERVELVGFLRQLMESQGPDERSRIELEVAGPIGALVVDPQRLEQVLRNLLDNALKFSPPGSPVRIRAALDGRSIVISVRDLGEGIPQEELRRIFDRFHQTGSVLTRDKEGAGLGLFITKRLVEAMGGSIEVSSERGRGSDFTVRLPADAATGISEPVALGPHAADRPA